MEVKGRGDIGEGREEKGKMMNFVQLVKTLSVCVTVCMQATVQLLGDIQSQLKPGQQAETTKMLLEAGFVELVKRIWQRHLGRDQLEQYQDLPQYISTLLEVGYSILIWVGCS